MTMILTTSLFVVLGVVVLANGDSVSSKESNVVDLNVDNFKQFIENNEYVFVMFYASWCRYSRAAKPEFNEASKKLAVTRPNLKFARVEETDNVDIMIGNDVTAFPTLKLFTIYNRDPILVDDHYYRWSAIEYDGEAIADDMTSWLIEETHG